MQVDVNGTRLWFDVDGPSLVPDGPIMATRPTVILLHGGPGTYDHSYFKPDFAPLTRLAQVVYLDLRDHGRSARPDPANWTFEVCADDVRAFCDALAIDRPIVYGHSMGGCVAMLYGVRHPGHAGALVLQSTMARFDLGAARRGLPSFWRRRGGRPGQARLRRRPDHQRGVGPSLRRVRAAGTGSGAARTEEAEPGGRSARDGAPPAVRRGRPARPRQLPDPRLRRRARSGHPGRRRARDRRRAASRRRSARGDRGCRPLSLEGRARPILGRHRGLRGGTSPATP